MSLPQSLRSPVNNQANVSPNPTRFVFDWVNSTGWTDRYINLVYGTDPGFGAGTFETFQFIRSSDIEIPLAVGTRYYWKYVIVAVVNGTAVFQGYWNGSALINGFTPTYTFQTFREQPPGIEIPDPVVPSPNPISTGGQYAPNAGSPSSTTANELFTSTNFLFAAAIGLVAYFLFLRN